MYKGPTKAVEQRALRGISCMRTKCSETFKMRNGFFYQPPAVRASLRIFLRSLSTIILIITYELHLQKKVGKKGVQRLTSSPHCQLSAHSRFGEKSHLSLRFGRLFTHFLCKYSLNVIIRMMKERDRRKSLGKHGIRGWVNPPFLILEVSEHYVLRHGELSTPLS